MSIKSLFEDIADAIREKSGSSDTYTPAEMPSAIRSIPSGSSTASGVSYDNTSSGLTASNVQDAIDELSGDVSTINSDLSEIEGHLTISGFGTGVDISQYTSWVNSYTCPSDGYATVYSGSGGNYAIVIHGVVWISAHYDGAYVSTYVRKGTVLHSSLHTGSGGAYFYPITP